MFISNIDWVTQIKNFLGDKMAKTDKKIIPVKTRHTLVAGYKKKLKKETATERLEKTAKILSDKKLHSVYNYNIEKTKLIKNLLKENPDLELAVEIIVSAIVSPTDLLTTSIHHSMTKSLLPFDTKNDIITIFEKELKEHYNIADKLYDWVYKAYIPGAFVFICIGDKYEKTIGMDKEHFKPRTEKEYIESLVNVTDDYSILKDKPKPFDMESASPEDKLKNLKKLMVLSNYGLEKNVDRPLVLEWPMESVIPICLKNEPSKHLRYILLLDSNGQPLDKRTLTINDDEQQPALKATINKLRSSRLATDTIKKDNKNVPIFDTSELLHQTINEKIDELTKDTNSFISDDDLELIKKIVFNKTMSDQQVNILLLDTNSVAYLTYEYKDNGVGKSPLEDLTILGGIRAMIRYTTLSTMVQNATQFTKIKVKLDDDDKDLEVRIQEAYDFIYSNRADSVPVGLLKIEDISDWLKSTGVLVEFEHENLPSIGFDIERLDTNKEVPDTALDENISKLQYMKLHLSPEMVDTSKEVDFAEIVKSSNVMFRRRLSRKHKATNLFLTNVQKVIMMNDGIISESIRKIIFRDLKQIRKELKKTLDEKIINNYNDDDIVEMMFVDVRNTILAELPTVGDTEENINSEMFSSVTESIDKILEEVVNEDMFPSEIIGDSADIVEYTRAMLKSSAIRRWLNKNGYYKDILKMFDTKGNDINIPLLEEYVDYAENFENGMKKFFKDMKKVRNRGNKLFERFNNGEVEEDDDIVDNNETMPTENKSVETPTEPELPDDIKE